MMSACGLWTNKLFQFSFCFTLIDLYIQVAWKLDQVLQKIIKRKRSNYYLFFTLIDLYTQVGWRLDQVLQEIKIYKIFIKQFIW